jgi:hypothetical protein
MVFGNNSMNFSNLTTVTEQLFISGLNAPPNTDLPATYNQFSYSWSMYQPYPGVNVVFPALDSAMAIGLWGNISRFAFLYRRVI